MIVKVVHTRQVFILVDESRSIFQNTGIRKIIGSMDSRSRKPPIWSSVISWYCGQSV